MKYQWILFDADETLFSFNSYLGLKPMLARYSIDFTPQDYEEFQAVNKPLWVAYQNKTISAKELQITRFQKLAAQTGQDPLALNRELMAEMALVSTPLDGVMEMLQTLQGKVNMGIITNGFQALQQQRLEKTKTSHFFDLVIVSETVGVAKPDTRIFDVAFQQMGNVDKRHILMVGDTLSSDILGGNQAGIDTAWLNLAQKPNDTDIHPTYQINNYRQLVQLVSGQ